MQSNHAQAVFPRRASLLTTVAAALALSIAPAARAQFNAPATTPVRDPAALNEKDLRRTMPRFDAEHWPHNRALVDAFEAIAAREGVTPAQLSLAWVLSRGRHVVAIPGTANAAHLAENFARWDWDLPAGVAGELGSLINADTVSGPRYTPAMQASIDTEEFASA